VSDIGIAALTFVCAFGGAILGNFIRSIVPATHLSKESQDVMKLGMGLVATMTALLLGLVTSAARSAFDSEDAIVRTSAANILTLDRLLARYGPETAPTRILLRNTVAFRVATTWPDDGSAGSGVTKTLATPVVEDIENQILRLSPGNDTQRWFKTESLRMSEEVLKARWRTLGAREGSVPTAFLVVVVFWLSATFVSFGLYSRTNPAVLAVLFVAAVSVAGAVFLILELDGPFDGVIRISSGPMRYALSQLGQ
jgi:hypothetical protein